MVNRPRQADEIEVTKAMIKAGVMEAGYPEFKYESGEQYVERIFIAMMCARLVEENECEGEENTV